MKRLCSGLFLLCFIFNLSLAAQDQEQIETQRQELERIKKELEVKRSSVEKLSKKEKGVLEELAGLEEELELVNKLVKKMGRQEQSLTKQVSLKNLELLEAELILKQKQKLLASRLNQVYRYGKLYRTGLLLASESPVDLLRRIFFLEKMTQKDRELVNQVADYMAQIEKTKEQLLGNLNELQKLKKDKQSEEKNRQTILAQKGNLLKNIRQDKQSELQAIAQLEQSQRELESIIEKLESERKKLTISLPEGVFAASKGKLPWPVAGNVISGFGEQIDPKTKTVTFNPGVVISSQLGQSVQAVADGLVIYNSFLRGYGRFLILQHDSGFYTLYGHLGEVLVDNGTLVRAGDVIAQVGDSGSLLGPALRFEIRQGKKQLDPLEWLK